MSSATLDAQHRRCDYHLQTAEPEHEPAQHPQLWFHFKPSRKKRQNYAAHREREDAIDIVGQCHSWGCVIAVEPRSRSVIGPESSAIERISVVGFCRYNGVSKMDCNNRARGLVTVMPQVPHDRNIRRRQEDNE